MKCKSLLYSVRK